MKDLNEIAASLVQAQEKREPIEPLSVTIPDLTLSDAYAIQIINAKKVINKGSRLMGYKIGLTSRAAQQHFKLDHPDFGHLFNSMCLPNNGEIDFTRLIQPKIEGEIAFILKKNIQGPGRTLKDVEEAVDCAVGALEIIDSRIKDWKITATDTIADNGSAAFFVLGSHKQKIENLDLPHIGMMFSRNGDIAFTGAGAAVMKNPLNALVFLVNQLGTMEIGLTAGAVILSGALSGMLPLIPSDLFCAEFLKLGRCSIRVKPDNISSKS